MAIYLTGDTHGMLDIERLTHTCPAFVAHQLVTSMYPGEESLQKYLNPPVSHLQRNRV